ncbi:molybdenum cofactor biosynthesis protein MoaE [Auraticoccus sp. F435]|uniref:Molybdenum cofactor biosynthesis protein MoaE n=1 Tax=Auraticoccus cholistanensis TaxID=2656650 RepID=A0A6A9UX74_9ACTN|nr:molybdenum cofactor biosynthesis protein MoaE [Auraticoccus cholistanensis]MVA76124.1 molybdenum cofactor biosynthesis protein MoaE [Auraticoccus cholistanensis]
MPTDLRHTALREEPLSLDAALAAVRDPACGGVAVFIGLVRDHDHGAGVSSLDYTAHPQAAELLARCTEQVAERHGVRAWVEHRTGHLEVGDAAVVVVTAAAHRGPALTACRELIDEIKAGVPIWKEQQLADGGVEWVGL